MQYQSFREEFRDRNGRVKGKFGFIDPQGILRITEYTADKRGYRQVPYSSTQYKNYQEYQDDNRKVKMKLPVHPSTTIRRNIQKVI
jgi:hypothetical protein